MGVTVIYNNAHVEPMLRLFSSAFLALPSRARLRSRSCKTPKMSVGNCYLQVLGTGNSEISPSILIFTDTRRYLFNCGENTWRFGSEHKVKVVRVRDVFLTRCSWQNLGGLPNLSMSLHKLGASPLRLHGPLELGGFLSATRAFLKKGDITLESTAEWKPYQDELITIQPVPLYPESEASLSPPSKRHRDAINNSTVAYVCKLPSSPGKFYPEKARELGLPPGRKYAQLVNGESVTTPDGNVVHPHDVVGPRLKGSEFIIVDCPHVSYIPSIMHSTKLNTPNVQPDIIVHICPRQVLDNSSYLQWLQTFEPAAKHLLVHSDFCPAEVALRAINKIQLPLHLLDSRFFNIRCHPLKIAEDPLLSLPNVPHSIVGQSLLKYHFLPPKMSGVVERSLKSITDEIEERFTEFASNDDLCQKLKLKQSCPISDTDSTSDMQALIPMPVIATPTVPSEPAVMFLGTAASTPCKYRTVSGILLHAALNRHMILDCGEGTLSQLYAYLGSKQADTVLRNLSAEMNFFLENRQKENLDKSWL